MARRQGTLSAWLACYSLGIWVAAQPNDRPVTAWPWLLLSLGLLLLAEKLWVLRGSLLLMAFWLGVGRGEWHPATSLSIPSGPVRLSGWISGNSPLTLWVKQISTCDSNEVLAACTAPLRANPVFQVKLKYKAETPLETGRLVTLQGELRTPLGPTLPGTFNEAQYLNNLNIQGVMSHIHALPLISAHTSENPPLWLQLNALTSRYQQYLLNVLKQAYPQQPENQALMGGLVLGDDALPLPKPYKQQMITTGLLHLVSASGMNLALVAGLLWWLTRWLPGVWTQRIILTIGTVIYATMTGFPPSVQRALVMLGLAGLSKIFNTHLKPVTLLTMAAALLLSIQPGLSQMLGFQFSVLATFGILWLVPKWLPEEKFRSSVTSLPLQQAGDNSTSFQSRLKHQLGLLLAVPLAAELLVLPWSTQVFHQWTWLALPMNMLTDWLVLPLTWLGFLAALCLPVWQPLASGLLYLAQPFLWLFQGLITAGSHFGGAYQHQAVWPLLSLIGWYLGWWAYGVWLRPREPIKSLGWKTLAIGSLLIWLPFTGRSISNHIPHQEVFFLPDGRSLTAHFWRQPQLAFCLQKPVAWQWWENKSLAHFMENAGLPGKAPTCPR